MKSVHYFSLIFTTREYKFELHCEIVRHCHTADSCVSIMFLSCMFYDITWLLQWPGGAMGVGSRHRKSRDRLPAIPLSGNNLRPVVHTHVPLSPSSIIWDR